MRMLMIISDEEKMKISRNEGEAVVWNEGSTKHKGKKKKENKTKRQTTVQNKEPT
jgi:hypothetical protein